MGSSPLVPKRAFGRGFNLGVYFLTSRCKGWPVSKASEKDIDRLLAPLLPNLVVCDLLAILRFSNPNVNDCLQL